MDRDITKKTSLIHLKSLKKSIRSSTSRKTFVRLICFERLILIAVPEACLRYYEISLMKHHRYLMGS